MDRKTIAVVYASENGRDRWKPVGKDDVPDWVREPVTMGRLLAGEKCMDCGEGQSGSLWYRAVPFHPVS